MVTRAPCTPAAPEEDACSLLERLSNLKFIDDFKVGYSPYGSPTTRSRRATCRRFRARVPVAAFFIILLNLIVDIFYAFLDPRVRYS